MAPWQKSTLLSAVVNKGRRVFSTDNRSTHSPPGDLHSATNPLTSPSSSTTSQKKFKKSNDARRDMSVLAMTYILQENPTIRELIRLIIGLNDHDDSGKLSEVLALSVTFTVQLASFSEEDSPKALIAITAFLATMRDIDAIARDGTVTRDNMNDIMKDSIKQIKTTHPALGNRNRNINGSHGLSGILDTIIGTTSTILNIFNEASSAIPVPFVHPLVASVSSLLTAVQQTRSNHGDMRQIAAVAGEFVIMLAETCAGDEIKPSRPFQQALGRLEKKLHDIAQQCNELGRRNVFWRFFQQGVDQGSLSGIKQDLQNAVVEFQTNTQLLQHLDLRSLSQVINRKLDEDAVNALPKSLSYVGRRDEYLPGSRSDDIKAIAGWLEDPDHVVFWMRGGAGLGKSTLAHQIVDSLRADDRLATFAFLLRGSSSDPATVIQSMARELGVLHPRAIPQVAMAARTCSSGHISLHEYIESYLLNPIHSLSYPYPLVIVVDALDEWEHCEAFLKELEHIPQPSSVRILLTSRPNLSIERSLLNVAVQKYQLLPVSQAITKAYFNNHFAKMDWEMRKPSPNIVSNLASLADGLLIWAAMVCSFLSYEMRADTPHKLLDQILSSTKHITRQGQLSSLYRDALTRLFQDDEERLLFKRVFGAMTVLRESLPLHDFARLLGISHNQVRGVQSRLTALQTRGAFDEQIVPPASERFHSSFIEFTMNREAEASNSSIPYQIDPQMAHQTMAEGCLSFLHDFLSSFRGRECRHSDLRAVELYTVKFWPLHMVNSNDRLTPLPPKLNILLSELPENHLRQWGSWFLAISIPTSSQNWDQVLGPIDKDDFYFSLAGFLKDNIMMDITLASSRTFCLEIAIRLQPKLLKAWEDLGDSYGTRFENAGILDLLNHAIIVYRHGLELCPKDDSESQLTCVSGLASALWRRSERTGSMVDLNEAILMDREALSFHPTPHPDRSSSLTNLGLRLWDRFRRTGSMTDLEEATLMHRESLSLCPTPHPNHSTSLNNLGIGLTERFVITGSMTDLEEGILIHRESLSLRPTPHPDRSYSLNNLASALFYRFKRTGLMTDLQEVILLHCESLSLSPPSHPYHSASLYNLADTLREHFIRTDSMTDLEEAILLHRESLSFRPTSHPDRFESLNGLACALSNRFGKTGSMTDLEEAIAMLREALSLQVGRAATHLNRLLILNNLAYLLETRYEKHGSQGDFDEAISLSQEITAMSK